MNVVGGHVSGASGWFDEAGTHRKGTAFQGKSIRWRAPFALIIRARLSLARWGKMGG